jgi:hypothetical protein
LSESESDAGWRHPSQIPCASSLHFSGPPKHYHSRVPRLSAAVGSPHCSTPIHQRDASNRPSGPAGSIALLRQEWVVVPRGGGRRVPRDAAARRGPITRRARTRIHGAGLSERWWRGHVIWRRRIHRSRFDGAGLPRGPAHWMLNTRR